MEKLQQFMFKVFQNTPENIPNSNEHDICTIFMSEISPTLQSPIIVLTCYHFFYAKCINLRASESEYFCPTCQNKNLEKILEQKDFIKNTISSIKPTAVNTLIECTPIPSNSADSNDPAMSTVTNINSSMIANSRNPAMPTVTNTNYSMIADSRNPATPTVTNSSKPTKPTALFNSSSSSGSDEALKKERIFLKILAELITPGEEMSRVSSSEEEKFENQLNKELQNNKIAVNKAKSKVYNRIIAYRSDITREALKKSTLRAYNVYNLFRAIGVDKISRIRNHKFDAISKLAKQQIETLILRVRFMEH
ncbi:26096_t:CDS:2 [Dentiscutata erythropus]|uniref:26096_t:CDS:1 n=1 Tax=Dentiscutata erythropus TaxID=1348616 RepID=A0A9N9NSF4_9GLOM|nr:26096_t:CDS:2 [Dentiscutata erythropus]